MIRMEIRPKVFCCKCYEKTEYDIEVSEEVASVREVTFSYPKTRAKCKVCGTEVYVPAINDKNVYERHKAYYEALKEIRKDAV